MTYMGIKNHRLNPNKTKIRCPGGSTKAPEVGPLSGRSRADHLAQPLHQWQEVAWVDMCRSEQISPYIDMSIT